MGNTWGKEEDEDCNDEVCDDDDDGCNYEEGCSYLNLTESKVFLLLPVISDVNKLAPEREIFELLEMTTTVTMYDKRV